MSWQEEVLNFWFGLAPAQWWHPDNDLDAVLKEKFAGIYDEKRRLPANCFLADPRSALAAVVLFDQLPRNMMRGHADQFATDGLALAIANDAIRRGYDLQLTDVERGMLYMPFQHSENLKDQEQSVMLFTMLGDDFQLGFAKKHHDVIARFGRFPHRNPILGREPRPDEIAAGNVTPW